MKNDNDKDQTVEEDDETVTSTHKGTQETSTVTNRPNIDTITARNEEESAQDKKSLYKKVGIAALLVVVIIIAVYFLNK